jgi:hypothetical protein
MRRLFAVLILLAACDNVPTKLPTYTAPPNTTWYMGVARFLDGSISSATVSAVDVDGQTTLRYRCIRIAGAIKNVLEVEEKAAIDFAKMPVGVGFEPETARVSLPVQAAGTGVGQVVGDSASWVADRAVKVPAFDLHFRAADHRYGTIGMEDMVTAARAACIRGT